MNKLLPLLLIFCAGRLFAQDNIPIGSWRTHFSYYNTLHVAVGADRVYAASENGLYFLNKSDNSITKISRLDGLQGADVSMLFYDKRTNQLFIGYHSGDMDVIRDNQIFNLDLNSNAQILSDKVVNHMTSYAGHGFVTTGYGVLRIDLKELRVIETYRELGETGQPLAVYQAAVLHDSLFLATQKGVIAADLSGEHNLLDYRSWTRFSDEDGIPGRPVSVLAALNDNLLAGINGDSLYLYAGRWKTLNRFGGAIYRSATATDKEFLLIHDEQLSILSDQGEVVQVQDALLSRPNGADYDENGILWVADGVNGLLGQEGQHFFSFTPSGPYSNIVYAMSHSGNSVYAFPGLTETNDKDLGFYRFENGIWTNYNSSSQTLPEFSDIVDVEYSSAHQNLFLASATDGLLRLPGSGEAFIFDADNSPLEESFEGLRIPGLEPGRDGLWVLNYGSATPLHHYDADGNWRSYSLNSTITGYPLDLLVVNGLIWMIIDPSQSAGMLVFDPETQSSRYLTELTGTGGLAAREVYSMAVDRDGMLWIGTVNGISVISSPSRVMTGAVDAIEPVYKDQYLLRGEKITAIKVDAGNRKWIGTTRGVWLFNDAADQELLNFTTANSPLPDNNILDIEINNASGEVFFATPKGVVSYRGSATASQEKHQYVKIFPNPVTDEFKGTVGISGLATDAIVKITDTAGKLIWQTQANGGTATWRIAENGKRPATGIYLVFSASEDGKETFVGKIAVIN